MTKKYRWIGVLVCFGFMSRACVCVLTESYIKYDNVLLLQDIFMNKILGVNKELESN